MKNKLFGIDVSRNKKQTIIRFWRHIGEDCTYKDIPVKTDSTYNRLFNILPIEGSSHFIHAEPNGLKISYLF